MKKLDLKWWIVALLFLAAVLNYVDKNSLSLLAPTIQADLGLSDQAYANVQNAFQVAYTITLLGSGLLVDRIGPRLSMALFLGWWSLANLVTALARSPASLSAFRFMLGLGEAGNWTAAPKAVAEWFPPKESGLAIGIYTAGTPVGMTLAPIFIIWLAGRSGWRTAFVVTGLAGFLWLIPWLMLGAGRRRSAQRVMTSAVEIRPKERGWSWLEAFGRAEVWCLLFGRMLSDPIWFFYQNWYPKYLVSARGLTQADVSIVWVMFLAAGLGSPAGGWLAGRFMKPGRGPSKARLVVMGGSAAVMPLSPLVAYAPTTAISLAIASLIVFAHLAWLTNISALVLDVVPAVSLATVFGIVAAGSSLGAIAMNEIVAKLVTHHSYTNWFWLAGWLHLAVLPLVAWGVLRAKSPRLKGAS